MGNLAQNTQSSDNLNPLKRKSICSDVIAGFLGKYFSYLKDVNDEQLAIDKSALTSKQFKTLSALKHIIDISDDVSRGFFNEVSSEGERRRNNRFLHGV